MVMRSLNKSKKFIDPGIVFIACDTKMNGVV